MKMVAELEKAIGDVLEFCVSESKDMETAMALSDKLLEDTLKAAKFITEGEHCGKSALHEKNKWNASGSDADDLHKKLHDLAMKKAEYCKAQESTEQSISKVLAEAKKARSELRKLKSEVINEVDSQKDKLDSAKFMYCSYLKFCGNVRLDNESPSGVVRGAISQQPTCDVTFQLAADTLSEVQLTNRLYRIAMMENSSTDRVPSVDGSRHEPAPAPAADPSVDDGQRELPPAPSADPSVDGSRREMPNAPSVDPSVDGRRPQLPPASPAHHGQGDNAAAGLQGDGTSADRGREGEATRGAANDMDVAPAAGNDVHCPTTTEAAYSGGVTGATSAEELCDKAAAQQTAQRPSVHHVINDVKQLSLLDGGKENVPENRQLSSVAN